MKNKYRNNKTMTYEQFVDAVKKESAELPVSKKYPNDYTVSINNWIEKHSRRQYENGDTVEGAVYDVGLMV